MAETNGAPVGAVNGYHHGDEKPSLKVLVVGAGIAGLSAAIGLRKQGYEVHVRDLRRFR